MSSKRLHISRVAANVKLINSHVGVRLWDQMKRALGIVVLGILIRPVVLAETTGSLSENGRAETETVQTSGPIIPISEREATEIVTRLYRSILSRDPDPVGLDLYVRIMLVKGKDAAWVSRMMRLYGSPPVEALKRQHRGRLGLAGLSVVILTVTVLLRRWRGSRGQQAQSAFRWAYALWILLLLNGVLLSVILETLTPAGKVESSLSYCRSFFGGQAGHDSWRPMRRAIEHLRDQPQIPLYSKILMTDRIKFQYPPSALPLPDLGQRLSHASWRRMWAFLNNVLWLGVLGIGVCTGYLLLGAVRCSSPSERDAGPWWGFLPLMALGLAHSLLFYPLTRSFRLGQVQTGMTLAAALSLIAWHHRKQAIAGVLLGLACAVKPQFGVVLVWAAVRRQWRFTIGFTASLGLLVVTSLLLYGFRHWSNYMSVLAFIGRHGESFFPNQSVNGLVHRLLFNGNNRLWVGNAYPPFDPIVYGMTLGSTVMLIGLALLWRIDRKPGTLDLACVLLTLTIASPIAWEHHYGLVLPVLAVVAPLAVARRSFGRFTASYLVVCLILTSHPMQWTNLFALSHMNVLQSYLLFGALMLLGCLYRTTYLEASRGRVEMPEGNTVEQEHTEPQDGSRKHVPHVPLEARNIRGESCLWVWGSR